MTNIIIALLAYGIDRIFGEFRFIKHPVIVIGEVIAFFESKLYAKSRAKGCLLVVLVLGSVGGFAFILEYYLELFNPFFMIPISSFIASMFIAHRMLRDEVKSIALENDLEKKRKRVAMIVSRDCESLSFSECNKAALESYAENLSDGVVAPLFYLTLFGLPGVIIYKTINTLDSMIGYKNKRYLEFGWCVAKIDDIANYIPARLTALLIMIRSKKFSKEAFKHAKLHESPNAGYPISAMAFALGVKVGGDTSYFGKIKKKAHFGVGKKDISKSDVLKALKIV